jgi:hypothetical protein
MPVKKKVKKPAVKAKHKQQKEDSVIQPVATRELPPQPVQESVPEVKEVVRETPVIKQFEEPEELPEKESEEETEEEPEPKRKKSGKRMVIGEAVEFGWNSVKSHLVFFIGIFLLFFALSFMIFGASAIATRVVLGILVAGISLGYFKVATDLVDEKAPEFKELFSCFSLLLKYLVATILYLIIVSVGLFLLVIPGVIWAVQFGFYPYAIVRDRLGPLAALRKSSAVTEGMKSRLIVFGLVLFGINLLGLIVLGLGIIVTIPLSVIAAAHIFSQLE